MPWLRSASSAGRVLFTIIICAMALPKQVIVIPLAQEMKLLHLSDTLWAVILPTVGWPFGVFLMKQFSETIPSALLEAARIDGAGELKTFGTVVLPIIKPGIGALAIFTFVNAWNEYLLQLVMLQQEQAGPSPWVLLPSRARCPTTSASSWPARPWPPSPSSSCSCAFQKYFTQGIAMGAVKG